MARFFRRCPGSQAASCLTSAQHSQWPILPSVRNIRRTTLYAAPESPDGQHTPSVPLYLALTGSTYPPAAQIVSALVSIPSNSASLAWSLLADVNCARHKAPICAFVGRRGRSGAPAHCHVLSKKIADLGPSERVIQTGEPVLGYSYLS